MNKSWQGLGEESVQSAAPNCAQRAQLLSLEVGADLGESGTHK